LFFDQKISFFADILVSDLQVAENIIEVSRLTQCALFHRFLMVVLNSLISKKQNCQKCGPDPILSQNTGILHLYEK